MNSSQNLRLIFFRADVYRLLALGFDFPSASVVETLSTLGDELAEASEGDDVLRGLFHDWAAEAKRNGQNIEAVYHPLFTTHVICPPCEGSYHRAERGPIIGDVTAFYEAFHLKAVSGQGPPDSIKMELGFMSWLCLKQASAFQEGRVADEKITIEAQKKFLADHLGRFAPVLAEKLRVSTDHPFYFLLGRLLDLWISRECGMFDVSPVPLMDPLPLAINSNEGELKCAL